MITKHNPKEISKTYKDGDMYTISQDDEYKSVIYLKINGVTIRTLSMTTIFFTLINMDDLNE